MRTEQQIRAALERLGGYEDGDAYIHDDNPTIALGARHILRWVLEDDTGLFGDHAEYPNIPVELHRNGDKQESFLEWSRRHVEEQEEEEEPSNS